LSHRLDLGGLVAQALAQFLVLFVVAADVVVQERGLCLYGRKLGALGIGRE
jgi:hypothetical protein